MKLLILVLAIAFVCAVLFVAGMISPRRSRRLQDRNDQVVGKVEREGREKAGRLGDFTSKALRKSRHAADQSAVKGRQIHREIRRH